MKQPSSFMLSCAALVIACLPLSSQAKSLQDEIVAARLLPGWQTEDSTHMAALEVKLASGWKTYWRNPGEAGIPPQFSWNGSQNLKAVIIHWPAPQVFQTNGLRSIGYSHDMLLPLELVAIDPSQPIHLAATVDLGVCRDICVPTQIVLDETLPLSGERDHHIEQALNAKPRRAQAAGLKNISCAVSPIRDGLAIEARITIPRQGSDETVAFELPNPNVWIAEAQTARIGDQLISSTELVDATGQPFALNRSSMRMTIISEKGAVEINGCPS